MNPCEKYEALLDAFAEGDLFTEDMIQVQQHLNGCPHCQSYLEDLLAIKAAFPSVEDTVVPEDFSAKVMAAVAATPQATPVAPAAAKKKTPWAKVLMPMAACCAIVVLLQSNPFRHLNAAREESAADMPMAAAVTEEGPAEEAAPEAKMELFADARIAEEPAAEAAMDTTSYAAAAPTQSFSYAPYCIRITVDADYIGDLLDNYQSEVSWEINGVSEMHYELTLAQYEDLLSALSDRNELPAEEVFETDSETVLVIVRQN